MGVWISGKREEVVVSVTGLFEGVWQADESPYYLEASRDKYAEEVRIELTDEGLVLMWSQDEGVYSWPVDCDAEGKVLDPEDLEEACFESMEVHTDDDGEYFLMAHSPARSEEYILQPFIEVGDDVKIYVDLAELTESCRKSLWPRG